MQTPRCTRATPAGGRQLPLNHQMPQSKAAPGKAASAWRSLPGARPRGAGWGARPNGGGRGHVPGLEAGGQRTVHCASLGDSFKAFMKSIEFENWAPRSSRTWRLGQQPVRQTEGSMDEASIEVLNQRLAGARRSGGGLAEAEAAAEADAQLASASGAPEQQQPQEPGGGGPQEAGSIFTRSTDEDVADALNRRIVEVAEALSMDEEDEEEELLTGSLLRELVMLKYGKAHDFAFVRRDLPLGKTLVCLNIMYPHLGMRSFPMREFDYMEKLDGIAGLLRTWGQDEKVVAFLKEPARPRKGLPARPIVGTAISIQLELDDATIAEWFPQR